MPLLGGMIYENNMTRMPMIIKTSPIKIPGSPVIVKRVSFSLPMFAFLVMTKIRPTIIKIDPTAYLSIFTTLVYNSQVTFASIYCYFLFTYQIRKAKKAKNNIAAINGPKTSPNVLFVLPPVYSTQLQTDKPNKTAPRLPYKMIAILVFLSIA